MAVPYTFAGATSAIPLSQLDTNFATTFTLGNTAIQLGNTVTTLNNMTLANVTISSGNVTITNVSVTTANVTTGNITTLTSTNATITNMSSGNVTITGGTINGTTLGATTASSANVTTLTTSSTVTLNGGTANGVAYLNGSKVLTTGSALTFDGTTFGVNFASSSNYRFYVSRGGTAGEVAAFTDGTAQTLTIDTAASSILLNSANGGALAFGVTTEQMRLTSTSLYTASGINVGIGTSSPQSRLEVRQDQSGAITRVIANNNFANTGAGSSFDYYFGTTRLGGLTHAFAASGAYLGFDVWNGSAATQRMVIDASGNLGLGVTPSAWSLANGAAIDIGTVGTIVSQQSGSTVTTEFGRNFYYNGTNFIYKVSGGVARYSFGSSAHNWFIAPSGTAGNTISFTQAMTLTSGGNLLVGATAETSARLFVSGGGLATAGIGGFGFAGNLAAGRLASNSTTNNNSINTVLDDSAIEIAAGSTYKNGIVVSGLNVASNAQTIQFFAGNNERARITSGGNLLVGTTTNNASGGVIQVSNGITFPATQSASSDANTLDDYEEGTWTPSVSNMTTTGSPAYGGKYIKIGQQVTIWFYSTNSSGTTYASTANSTQVTGLPFACEIPVGASTVIAGVAINGSTTNGGFVQGPQNGGTNFYFNTSIAATGGIAATITYWTT